jgi:hypothetical protein
MTKISFLRQNQLEQEEEREILKAADLFQVDGLMKHCLEEFGRSLKVTTVVSQVLQKLLTYDHACSRMLTYAVTHADVC